MSPSFTIYEAGTFVDWDGDSKRCLFFILPKKTLFCVGYPAILALGVMKGQTMLPSLHWIRRMTRLVHPIMILNIVSINIFFALGKMIGTV